MRKVYLQDRNGIKYEVNSEVAYTGKHVEWYPDGQKSREGNYKDGKKEGLQPEWHENGQKQSEGNYKGGKEVGLHTWWHEDGQKKFEGNYKDGKLVK